jgi:hypothetical protein
VLDSGVTGHDITIGKIHPMGIQRQIAESQSLISARPHSAPAIALA